jgi:Zn-dependent metalloprotease
MKPILAATLVLLSLSVCQPVIAQNNNPAIIPGATSVRMDATGNVPVFVTFDPAHAFKTAEPDALKKVLFGNRPTDSWQEIRTETDQLGMVHTRYQQLYQNVPVEGNVYIFHGRDGKIVSANGHFTPGIDLPVAPALSGEEALELAASGMKRPVSSTLLEKTATTLLLTEKNGTLYLAYKCQVYCSQPFVNAAVYVDAQTGAVLKELDQFCSIDANGLAHTQFSGDRVIVTDSLAPNSYSLRESGRGNGIETVNQFMGIPFADTDNDWNNVNPAMDEFAVDIHFGAEVTYDFFHDRYGLNSFDGQGAVMKSKFHVVGLGPSAQWNTFYTHEALFGDGDDDHFPFTSLDVVGHEFTHGVTEFSAGLIYGDESGALNESFSDIFGSTIRFLTDPPAGSWLIGDQLLRPGAIGPPALRSMSNPNLYMCADTYEGVYWDNLDIVHFNSGVQNYWYYLLVEGGSGSNDFGDNYSVSGIGLESAMDIAYRNLMYYLTPTATFEDARNGSEQAAVDLFGACSNEHYQVAHAWYAVGVGPDVTTSLATASFTTENNFACTAPLTTTFHGAGAYLSYTWDFGDGTTSTLQDPSHTYTNSGTYDVQLIVFNNDALCQQPDTILIQEVVVIAPIDPVAGFQLTSNQIEDLPVDFADTSLYGPLSWEWNFGDGATSALQHPSHTYADTGIYTVQLIVHNCHGSDTIVQLVDVVAPILLCQTFVTYKDHGLIFDSGGETGEYGNNEDCGLMIRPCHASAITLTFDSLNLSLGDKLFVFDGTDNMGVMLAYITQNFIPDPVTATEGAMYVLFQSDPGTTASGFQLHYAAELNGFAGPNSAHFVADTSGTGNLEDMLWGDTVRIDPGYLQFYDRSTQDPYTWHWDFGDGTTSEGYPYAMHGFLNDGFYTVTLTVTFCDGYSDSYDVVVAVGTAGIDELTNEEPLLTIAPNPFREQLTIGTGQTLYRLELHLLDMSGRIVYDLSEPVVSTEGIVVAPAGLSSGHYLLEARYLRENGIQGFERHKVQLQR